MPRFTHHIQLGPVTMPRFVAGLSVLVVLLLAASPRLAAAQAAQPVSQLESSLSSPRWTERAAAVSALSRRAPEVTPSGLTALIGLLDSELGGTASTAGDAGDEDEAYSEYIMMLTQLVARYNDPRTVPVLAKQGIALTNSSVYRVAMAGDAGIAPLVNTWRENENLRPAVIRTMGEMRYYADSTGAALSESTRATISDFVLQASAAPEPWVRHAFLDAAATIGDPVLLPVVSDLAASDPASIDGRPYVAITAGEVAQRLAARRDGRPGADLLQSLQLQEAALCRIGWIDKSGVCTSLDAKLQSAADAIARNDNGAANNVLNALQNELSAQRGKSVNERAYALLAGNARYIASRL